MSKSANIKNLLSEAKDEGILSKQSMQAFNIPDLGARIQAGLGIKVDDVKASEVVLVTLLVDDSGSIRFAGNAELVREGHNTILEALKESKQEDNIFIHTRYLNGEVLYPYIEIANAIKMDSSNYDPNKGTPLYDETVVLLGTVITAAQEFKSSGVPARTITLIVSDGADEHSHRSGAKDVASIVSDMLHEERNIVAAMGIDDGGRTDFRKIFGAMGIRDEWILTPKNSKSEIRKAFQTFSKSAVRASQNAGSFSKTALGGFGSP